MKATAEQSADLKMALKHDACTPELVAEAEAFPLEADEAAWEVEQGYDDCHPASWVASAIGTGEAAMTQIVCKGCGAELRPGQHFIVKVTEPESFENWRETWTPAPDDGPYHQDCAPTDYEITDAA